MYDEYRPLFRRRERSGYYKTGSKRFGCDASARGDESIVQSVVSKTRLEVRLDLLLYLTRRSRTVLVKF